MTTLNENNQPTLQEVKCPLTFKNNEETYEEEQQIDEELQKKLQNVQIDDSAFTQKDTNKARDENSKNSKKGKKNKGQDFLDYANKNGIQVNFVYEDNKQEKRDKPESEHKGHASTSGYKGGNPKYQKNEGQYGQSKYKSGYGNKPRKPMHKFGNNKFDLCNMHIPKMTVYDPFLMQEYNQQGYVPHQNNHMTKPIPVIKEDEEILQFLEHYFSLENMNQDLYLRNRIDENGFIKVEEIAHFNAMKQNQIHAEKILQIAKQADFIESTQNSEGSNLLRNKDWDNMKEGLLTKEQITSNKRMQKRNEKFAMNSMMNMYPMNQQMNPMMPQMMSQVPMNYVHLQNNYFFQTFPNNQTPSYGGYPTPQMYGNYNLQTRTDVEGEESK